MRLSIITCFAILTISLGVVSAKAESIAGEDPFAGMQIDIPTKSFKLNNGLTVVVHEDHSAPLVAMDIWYHVGSKNEERGKSGLAHLFEHLMFNGSENFNDDFFKATQRLGATNMNGTTNFDRTSYFQTVPKASLDAMLWLESDRMGHLLGAIDQSRLNEQRDVVKNEKRQRENAPYAKAWDLIKRATYPVGHPYDHSVIGSMEDLDAASLKDVQDWFRTYYGPSNTVLSLVGDITLGEAREKVEKYFGDIPPGPPISQLKSWIVPRSGTAREVAFDNVTQARVYRAWNISPFADKDNAELELLGDVLAGDANSRLHKRLVVADKLASAVQVYMDKREISGQFMIITDVKAGIDPGLVEKAVDEELHALLRAGPTETELARLRTSYTANLVRSLEISGMKAGTLAESQTYYGRPDGWKTRMQIYRTTTPARLQEIGKRWLSDGDYVLQILPFGNLASSGKGVDRTHVPTPTAIEIGSFPTVQRVELKNGLKVIVAPRTGVPVVNLSLIVRTGTSQKFATQKAGVGQLVAALLKEGTSTLSQGQLTEALGSLGAVLSTSGGDETTTVAVSAMKPALKRTLDLYSDVLMQPGFRDPDVDRVRDQAAAELANTKKDPNLAAGRLLPSALFGKGHPYSQLVTEQSLNSITTEDIREFYGDWFHPNNATLIVAGDTTAEEVLPLIEASFSDWRPAKLPETLIPESAETKSSTVFFVDMPGAKQTVIRAGFIAPPRREGDTISRRAFNMVLGGSFVSRVNLKLREEKGWAYNARSRIVGGRGAQMFFVSTSVQTDKSSESMSEIDQILKRAIADDPVGVEELAAAKDKLSLGLSSDWSTSEGIANALAEEETYALPAGYYEKFARSVADLTPVEVNAEARRLIAGRPITWLVVGDGALIEAKVRALKLGEFKVIDGDANEDH